ncbi:L-rhamnose-binding lectin CSL3-like, partial [Amphiura filiformis]|uniref:L-rhamnose-binding lectin CSL3-like n=1 Tax=Amphiura filiformis TaxID=82378 RepID=UPI003B21E916
MRKQDDYVCEHSNFHLECPTGQRISVSSALYGRQTSDVCTDGPGIQTVNCAADNSLDVVRQRCEGHDTCDIQASNGVFGDPCVGTFKYLEIQYSCEDDYVCEHSNFHLECPAGQRISVSSALYGRQTSDVCTDGPGIQTVNCAADNSLDVVRQRCEGQETCDIQASNGVFGDPCVGTFKYLEIQYSCEDDYVCEHSNFHLECPAGQRISVSSALYGRQTSDVCT